MDTRVLTKPKAWAGAVDDWKRFKFQLMSYISAVSPRLGEIMRRAATLDQPISMVDLTPEDGVLDGQLFAVLAASLEGEALDQLMNSEEGAGLETWRRFCHGQRKQGFVHYEEMDEETRRILLARQAANAAHSEHRSFAYGS
eukprot:4042773-Amphidinium_carterae.1